MKAQNGSKSSPRTGEENRQQSENPKRNGKGETTLWSLSFSSTSGPDISDLISHAEVVGR